MNVATISEQQVFSSIAGGQASSPLTEAIDHAELMYQRGAGCMTVVETNAGIQIFSEFSMNVRSKEVIRCLYSAPDGFYYPMSA